MSSIQSLLNKIKAAFLLYTISAYQLPPVNGDEFIEWNL